MPRKSKTEIAAEYATCDSCHRECRVDDHRPYWMSFNSSEDSTFTCLACSLPDEEQVDEIEDIIDSLDHQYDEFDGDITAYLD